MNDRQLLQKALNALDSTTPSGWSIDSTKQFYDVIEAIRTRLTYSELEPVGCIKEVHTKTSFGGTAAIVPQMYCFLPIGTILYARTNKETK